MFISRIRWSPWVFPFNTHIHSGWTSRHFMWSFIKSPLGEMERGEFLKEDFALAAFSTRYLQLMQRFMLRFMNRDTKSFLLKVTSKGTRSSRGILLFMKPLSLSGWIDFGRMSWTMTACSWRGLWKVQKGATHPVCSGFYLLSWCKVK